MRRTKKWFSPEAAAGISVQVTGPQPTILQGQALRDVINGQSGPGSPVQVVDGVVYQAMGRRSSIDEKAQSATFTILTTREQANRHGNRVHVGANRYGQGMRLEEWRKNPIVYFEHGFTDPLPIGSAEREGKVHVEMAGDTLASTVFFHGMTRTSDDVWKLVKADIIRMASIGFAPELALPLTQSEAEKAERGNGAFVMQHTWLEIFQGEMTEWSVTPLGVDRGAMRQAVDRRKVDGERVGGDMLAWMALHADDRKPYGIGFQQSAAAPAAIPVQVTVVVKDERAGVVQGQAADASAAEATPGAPEAPAPAVPVIQQSVPAGNSPTIVIPQAAPVQPVFDQALMVRAISQAVSSGMKPLLDQQAQNTQQMAELAALVSRSVGTF